MFSWWVWFRWQTLGMVNMHRDSQKTLLLYVLFLPLLSMKRLQAMGFGVNSPSASENSSVGRAQPCQGWGREFESRFSLNRQGTSERKSFCFSGHFIGPSQSRTRSAMRWAAPRCPVTQRLAARPLDVRFRSIQGSQGFGHLHRGPQWHTRSGRLRPRPAISRKPLRWPAHGDGHAKAAGSRVLCTPAPHPPPTTARSARR